MKPLKIIYYLGLGIIAFLAILLIFSTFPIPGNYKLMVVQSGSMQPAIKLGSVVIVKPATDYQKGEIITFADDKNPRNVITHRIFEIKEEGEKTSFITKGDANNAPDPREVTKREVIGKVLFTLPLIGYGVATVRTPIGFMLLIVLPATLIIYDEIRKIKDEVVKMRSKKALLFILIVSVSLMTFNFTKAYLTDTETSTGNIFQVTTWGVWKVTEKGEFEAGTLSNVDTTTSPGDAMLTGAYQVLGDTVALWHLNEGSGATAYDETGNNNDGTINGAGWAAGKHSQALLFDGVDDYVSVSDSASLNFATNDFTVEAWINVNGTSLLSNQEYGIVNKNVTFQNSNGWGLEIHTYGCDPEKFRVEFYITSQSAWGNTNVKSDINQTSDTWHHVAGVRQGTTTRLYWDGALVAEKTHADAGLSVDNTQPVILGDHSWGPNFPGIIDEVRISNTAKTSFPIDYFSSGTLESQVFNAGEVRDWNRLEWDEDLPSNTDITLEVATSTDGSTWSAWSLLSSDSPIDLTTLPNTQYIKWKATLTTTDPSKTPKLEEVRVRHYSP